MGRVKDGEIASCLDEVGAVALHSSLRQGMDVGDPEGTRIGEVGVAQTFAIGGYKIA